MNMRSAHVQLVDEPVSNRVPAPFDPEAALAFTQEFFSAIEIVARTA